MSSAPHQDHSLHRTPLPTTTTFNNDPLLLRCHRDSNILEWIRRLTRFLREWLKGIIKMSQAYDYRYLLSESGCLPDRILVMFSETVRRTKDRYLDLSRLNHLMSDRRRQNPLAQI